MKIKHNNSIQVKNMSKNKPSNPQSKNSRYSPVPQVVNYYMQNAQNVYVDQSRSVDANIHSLNASHSAENRIKS